MLMFAFHTMSETSSASHHYVYITKLHRNCEKKTTGKRIDVIKTINVKKTNALKQFVNIRFNAMFLLNFILPGRTVTKF